MASVWCTADRANNGEGVVAAGAGGGRHRGSRPARDGRQVSRHPRPPPAWHPAHSNFPKRFGGILRCTKILQIAWHFSVTITRELNAQLSRKTLQVEYFSELGDQIKHVN